MELAMDPAVSPEPQPQALPAAPPAPPAATTPYPTGAVYPAGTVYPSGAVYPVGTPAPGPAAPPHNVLAWVSLGLGAAFILFGTVASIAAVICGHIAQGQIRDRGEQGANAARWGLILGYAGIALTVLAVIALVIFLVIAFGVAGVADQRL
jgi:hypothetical protein